MEVGRLEKVPLREIWKKEARHFGPWLEENIDILGDALNLSLSSVEREKTIGTFAVDLLAEDAEGARVVIEYQLEKTDHDHLGKVLTYLTNLDAKTAIWISNDPRPEHAKAITWLNETTPADVSFYLVKVEGVRIAESPAAPLFSVICTPSEETKEIGDEKKELAERHKKRLKFWAQLLVKSKEKTTLHANISPGKENWIAAGAGKSGLSYNYSITMTSGTVELYIDRGKDAGQVNEQIFDSIYANKTQVESEFGEILSWERLEGRRACRIKWTCSETGLRNEDKWSYLQNQMVDAMVRLEGALKSHIERLSL